MNIIVNGKNIEFSGTIQELIKKYKLDDTAIAVERNGEIIHREEYSSTNIEESDKIELVNFVGGG